MPRHATPRASVPASPAGTPSRAPALLITVLGLRPVFACGRWFQPGPPTACPAGYFSARQWRDLEANPGLNLRLGTAP